MQQASGFRNCLWFQFYRSNDYKPTGLIATTNNFSTSIFKSDRVYNQFEFTRAQNHNLSLYGNIRWQRFIFFWRKRIIKEWRKGVHLRLSYKPFRSNGFCNDPLGLQRDSLLPGRSAGRSFVGHYARPIVFQLAVTDQPETLKG